MSLWSDYIRECGLLEIIEEDWGFITFHIQGGGEVLFLNDLYVKPEFRRRGNAMVLVHRAMAWGRDKGCKRVTSTVHTGSKVASETLAGILHVGFKIYGAVNDVIVVTHPL